MSKINFSKYWIGGKSFNHDYDEAQVRAEVEAEAEARVRYHYENNPRTALLNAVVEAEAQVQAQVKARYLAHCEDEYDRWKARSIDTDVHQLHLNLGFD